jgi:hypothetical protein
MRGNQLPRIFVFRPLSLTRHCDCEKKTAVRSIHGVIEMRRFSSLVLIALLLQQTSLVLVAGPSRVAAKGLQQSQSPVAVLTNQDVLNMTKAQLAPEIIIAKIRTSDCNFNTSPGELQRLKSESVPDEIIVAMISAPKTEKNPSVVATEADKPAPIKIPDGTLVEVESVYTVVSSDIEAGNAISFSVVAPVKIDGVTVVAAGALATGRVVKAKRGGRWGRAGQLAWKMQDVTAVDGTRIPVQFTRNQKGDSKAGTVTTGVIVTGLLLLPIAPIGLLWGFKRGEDAFISAGRRYDVFTSGNSSVTPLPETSK